MRLLIEPQQGATYTQVLRLVRHAEERGFDGVFTSDHYLRIGVGDRGPGPLDAWTLLAGLARDVRRIRLGTMMSPVTFRNPGVLAVIAAQVDEMSGGRLELGLGAGWFEDEHRALGIPFPGVDERFDRLEEALEIITRIWRNEDGELFTFSGSQYRIENWPALPVPVQRPRPPLLLGGQGPRRTPMLAARFADEFNVPFDTPARVRAATDRVRRACADLGRDTDEIVYSAALVLCGGRTAKDVARRVVDTGEPLDEVNRMGAAGTADILAKTMSAYLAAGVTRLYAQIVNVQDIEHLDVLADAAELAGLST